MRTSEKRSRLSAAGRVASNTSCGARRQWPVARETHATPRSMWHAVERTGRSALQRTRKMRRPEAGTRESAPLAHTASGARRWIIYKAPRASAHRRDAPSGGARTRRRSGTRDARAPRAASRHSTRSISQAGSCVQAVQSAYQLTSDWPSRLLHRLDSTRGVCSWRQRDASVSY